MCCSALRIYYRDWKRSRALDLAATLAQRPETWLQSEYTSLFAMSVLWGYAPDDLAEPLRDLDRILKSLPAQDTIVLLPPLLSELPFVRDALGPLIIEMMQGDGPHGAHLDHVKEWVTPEILQDVLLEVDVAALDRETQQSLLSHMVANGLVSEAMYLIQGIDNSFAVNDAIKQVAPHCPNHALRGFAGLVSVDLARVPLAIRAAACGDVDLAEELLPKDQSSWRDEAVQKVCTVAPIETFEQLKALIETLSPISRARPMTDLVLRLPQSERKEHLPALLSTIGKSGSIRASCLERLTADLALMPAKELTDAFIAALRKADTTEDIYVDLRGFGPALVERFGAGTAIALESEVANVAKLGWP